MRAILLPAFLAAIFLATTDAQAEKNEKQAERPAITFSLTDLKGTAHGLDQNDDKRVRALVFLSTECPISNGYLKTLNDVRVKIAHTGNKVGAASARAPRP